MPAMYQALFQDTTVRGKKAIPPLTVHLNVKI